MDKRFESVPRSKSQDLLPIPPHLHNYQERKFYSIQIYFKYLIKLLLTSDSVTQLHAMSTGKLLGDI